MTLNASFILTTSEVETSALFQSLSAQYKAEFWKHFENVVRQTEVKYGETGASLDEYVSYVRHQGKAKMSRHVQRTFYLLYLYDRPSAEQVFRVLSQETAPSPQVFARSYFAIDEKTVEGDYVAANDFAQQALASALAMLDRHPLQERNLRGVRDLVFKYAYIQSLSDECFLQNDEECFERHTAKLEMQAYEDQPRYVWWRKLLTLHLMLTASNM